MPPQMAVPRLWWLLLFLCGSIGALVQHDADLIFDDLTDSSPLPSSINPLSSPSLSHDESSHSNHSKLRTKRRVHHHRNRERFLDDEDFYRDAEDGPSGFPESGEKELPEVPIPRRPPIVEEGPFYFRLTLTITNLPYTPELAQKTSADFKRVSEEIILALEGFYRTIPGQQAVTVISYGPLHSSAREPVLVTLDVGSLGNNDRKGIEDVIKQALESGSLGRYRLSNEGYSFRSFGTQTGISQVCAPDQLTCNSGECVHITKRCNDVRDCRDGSDELNCRVTACQSGEFQCDGSRCIDERRRCDRRFDCTDRTDEIDCPGSLVFYFQFGFLWFSLYFENFIFVHLTAN
jgi:hypothetical protein